MQLSLRLFLVFCLSFPFLESCHKQNQPNPSSIQGHSSHYLQGVLSGDIPHFDPAISFDQISSKVLSQIYEPLYEYVPNQLPYTLRPLLAASMPEIDSTGTHWTIKIKKGIFYHPSTHFPDTQREVKAKDFITQIRRVAYAPLKGQLWWSLEGKIKGLDTFREKATTFTEMLTLPIEGLEATDDYTLNIHLTKPSPQLLYIMSMTHFCPMPEEVVQKENNEFLQKEVGTGPFSLVKWHTGLSIELKKTLNYHDVKSLGNLEGIHFHIIKEAQTRWLNFLSEKIDYLDTVPKDHFEDVFTKTGELQLSLKNKGIEFNSNPSVTYWWIEFNMEDPVMKNPFLRKAIAHAINYEKFMDLFVQKNGVKANSIFPPVVKGHDPHHRWPYEYNVAKAQSYLTKAGFGPKNPPPTLRFDLRSNETSARQQGEFIQQELAAIGLKVQVSLNPFATFLQRQQKGELQFYLGGWGLDYPDAENVLLILSGKQKAPTGPNYARYDNPKVDELIAQYEKLSYRDGKKEKEAENILKKIEALVEEDLPWAMLYYSELITLKHGRLQNFHPSDLAFRYFKYTKK